MKKYKDLIIHCGSDEAALLGLVAIEERCNGKPFSYSEEVERMYDANNPLLHILVEMPETPSAILLVFANDAKIKVINIVPFQHSCDHIEKNIYNHIVDTFNDKVITPLFSEKYNEFNPRSRLFLDFGMEMQKNFPTKPCEKETN